HEMTAARGEPFDNQLTRAFEINQPNIAASTDDLPPIGASQRRAGDYPVLSATTPLIDDCGNRRQPRLAIGSCERLAAPHLRDILGGMEVIALLEFPAEPFCQAPSNRAFAGARNPHDDGDHRDVRAWPHGSSLQAPRRHYAPDLPFGRSQEHFRNVQPEFSRVPRKTVGPLGARPGEPPN